MKSKYMMATTAIHMLGDISRDEPDLCVVHSETDTDYVGMWVFGLGFCDVKFPKVATRELTADEATKYNGTGIAIHSLRTGEKSYDCGSINIEAAK